MVVCTSRSGEENGTSTHVLYFVSFILLHSSPKSYYVVFACSNGGTGPV